MWKILKSFNVKKIKSIWNNLLTYYVIWHYVRQNNNLNIEYYYPTDSSEYSAYGIYIELGEIQREIYFYIDNFDLFIARTYKDFRNEEGYEITNHPISKNDYDVMKQFEFNYSDDYINIPRRINFKSVDYEYITIYSNSHICFFKLR